MDDRRKALKLAATFQFSQITCPGVYLDDRNNELILHIIILGKNYVSPGLNPLFPALINEQFHVEKIFKNCSDPWVGV